MADCTTWTRRAARVKLRSMATATKCSTCRSSTRQIIYVVDGTYQYLSLDVLTDRMSHGSCEHRVDAAHRARRGTHGAAGRHRVTAARTGHRHLRGIGLRKDIPARRRRAPS